MARQELVPSAERAASAAPLTRALLFEGFWQGLLLSLAVEQLQGWLWQIPPGSETMWPR